MQAKRHAKILSYVRTHDFLSLRDAIQLLQASRSTVWHDFLVLASHGLVQRTRGGIQKCAAGPASISTFDQRQIKFAQEKNAIALRAAQLLRDGDVFIADGGTTTYQLAAHVPSVPLTLVTVSIPLLVALSKRKGELGALEILVVGGVYSPDLAILVGTRVQEGLSQIHAQWAFLGVDGVTEDGISNNNYLSVDSKLQMIRNSDKVAVLADHSKIGRRAMTMLTGLNEIDLLITSECSDNAPALTKIRDRGLNVMLVTLEESEVPVAELVL